MPKRSRSGCIAAFYKSYSTNSPAPRHGYCIAQYIRQTTESVLRVEEGCCSRRMRNLPAFGAVLDRLALAS